MPRKKETCLCEPGQPCGYVEVKGPTVTALRKMGAVVKRGLGNRLPGSWVRGCWMRAYDAQKRLTGPTVIKRGDTKKFPSKPRRRPRPRWPAGR